PVTSIELAQHRLEMAADRLLTDPQPLGDLTVRCSLSRELQDRPLALAEGTARPTIPALELAELRGDEALASLQGIERAQKHGVVLELADQGRDLQLTDNLRQALLLQAAVEEHRQPGPAPAQQMSHVDP